VGRVSKVNWESVSDPEDVPLKRNEVATGGSTIYGWAVDYYISLRTLRITDLHYER